MTGKLLVLILGVFSYADNPFWQVYSTGSTHSLWARPDGSGSDYTQVFIGCNYTSEKNGIFSSMLTVKPKGTKIDGIEAWGNLDNSSSKAVTGLNNQGIGLYGFAYYGTGIMGECGDGNGSLQGYAGRFKHNTPTGIALQVDKGKVNFLTGNTTISSNTTNDHNPLLTISYNGTDSYDHIGVNVISAPCAYYGVGGCFEGGYKGIVGNASILGDGKRYGGEFTASGGSANYGIWANAGWGTNDWAGWFNGKVYTTNDYFKPSDEKLKKDVSKLDRSIEKVMKLKPVNYYYKTDEYPTMKLSNEKQFGLIAQELETVFPEFVCETIVPQDKDSTENVQIDKEPLKIKTVNYTSLIPVLISAIQEQQKMIDELKKNMY